MPWSGVELAQVTTLRRWSKVDDIHRPRSVEVDMECKSDSQLTSIPLGIALKSAMRQNRYYPSARPVPRKRRCIIEVSFTFIFQRQPCTYRQRLAGGAMEGIHQRPSFQEHRSQAGANSERFRG